MEEEVEAVADPEIGLKVVVIVVIVLGAESRELVIKNLKDYRSREKHNFTH